jgi:DNA-damage-inducible protein J
LLLSWQKAFDAVLQMPRIQGMKTAAIHSRINADIKERADAILTHLGLSPTEAIRMFYTQITLRNGLPFEVEIPNSVTLTAMEDSRNGRKLLKHNSVDELATVWNPPVCESGTRSHTVSPKSYASG